MRPGCRLPFLVDIIDGYAAFLRAQRDLVRSLGGCSGFLMTLVFLDGHYDYDIPYGFVFFTFYSMTTKIASFSFIW